MEDQDDYEEEGSQQRILNGTIPASEQKHRKGVSSEVIDSVRGKREVESVHDGTARQSEGELLMQMADEMIH